MVPGATGAVLHLTVPHDMQCHGWAKLLNVVKLANEEAGRGVLYDIVHNNIGRIFN